MTLMLSSCLVTAAIAQDVKKKATDKNKAIDILKKADAAASAVKVVRYDAKFEPVGWLTDFADPVEGRVVLGGEYFRQVERFRYDVKVKGSGSSEKRRLSIGSDGNTYYLIDHDKKTVLVGTDGDRVLSGVSRWVRRFGMVEFVHPTPFSYEITADLVELQETRKIGDQECYQIHVVYADNVGEAVWFFSKKDYLPRRVDRIRYNRQSGEKGILRSTLTNLTADPKFIDDPFKLRVPEGYTKTVDEP
jgi:hypothetical protein